MRRRGSLWARNKVLAIALVLIEVEAVVESAGIHVGAESTLKLGDEAAIGPLTAIV
jgi:hypothetical protein